MMINLETSLKLFDKILGLLFLGAFFMLLREVDGLQASVKEMSKSVTQLNTSLAVVLNTQHYQGETLKLHEIKINEVSRELNKLGGK